MELLDLVIWGTIMIAGIAIGLITIVLGVYFMITKTKPKSKEKKQYDLKNQQEIK